jgi:GTP-binding protein HflX
VHDSLFTTLDPIARSLRLSNGEQVVISDTVGFLHNLPHHLVDAFKATLEEVAQSDLLIHVLDVSHPRASEHVKAVKKVLEELGADKIPVITALNKIDLFDTDPGLSGMSADFVNPVLISAKFNQNLASLTAQIEGVFAGRMTSMELKVPITRMDLINWFYQNGKVQDIIYGHDTITLKVIMPKNSLRHLLLKKEIEIIN